MQIPSLDADLDAIFAHAGDTVKIGGVTGRGSLRREPIEAATDSGLKVIGKRYQLTVRDGAFSGYAQDVAVEVNGDDFKIENIGVVGPDRCRRLILVEAD